MSSIDIYIMLWLCANIYPGIENNPKRDRIVISHGHTAAAVYAVLGNIGYFNIEDAVKNFRRDGSPFEGHPNTEVPGVEWCSGSLGQGLSVGCGFAVAAKITGKNYHVFVVMGDGEQAKGQFQEAREFAVKFGLGNLTAIIDFNNLQASGKIENIMPQNIPGKYESSGWRVLSIDGHDYQQIFQALRTCYLRKDVPTLIIAKTVMGKGISFVENNHEYHGKVLDSKQYECALKELGFDNTTQDVSLYADSIDMHEISRLIPGAERLKLEETPKEEPVEYKVNPGNPLIYEAGSMVDCRTAFGEALYDIALQNSERNSVHMVAIDCDLVESVKLKKFAQKFPERLVECGIQEHNGVTLAGALSKSGVLTFVADFGVFGLDEVYGQLR
ncbi:MAG: transketolase, partial [Clostridiaceae bacterium]|nr:transketolase [Clostridiaceae bacterium]